MVGAGNEDEENPARESDGEGKGIRGLRIDSEGKNEGEPEEEECDREEGKD